MSNMSTPITDEKAALIERLTNALNTLTANMNAYMRHVNGENDSAAAKEDSASDGDTVIDEERGEVYAWLKARCELSYQEESLMKWYHKYGCQMPLTIDSVKKTCLDEFKKALSDESVNDEWKRVSIRFKKSIGYHFSCKEYPSVQYLFMYAFLISLGVPNGNMHMLMESKFADKKDRELFIYRFTKE